MSKTGSPFIALFIKITAGVFVLILLGGLLSDIADLFSISLGYLLSLFFVGSNLLIVPKIDLEDHQKFNRIFYTSMILRFVLVLASIIFVLKVIKIHQIYFTVSFIISYIFHSGIEIIFINKILETDN